MHSNKIKKKSACKNFKSCIYNIQILVSETILATTILPLRLFKLREIKDAPSSLHVMKLKKYQKCISEIESHLKNQQGTLRHRCKISKIKMLISSRTFLGRNILDLFLKFDAEMHGLQYICISVKRCCSCKYGFLY